MNSRKNERRSSFTRNRLFTFENLKFTTFHFGSSKCKMLGILNEAEKKDRSHSSYHFVFIGKKLIGFIYIAIRDIESIYQAAPYTSNRMPQQ